MKPTGKPRPNNAINDSAMFLERLIKDNNPIRDEMTIVAIVVVVVAGISCVSRRAMQNSIVSPATKDTILNARRTRSPLPSFGATDSLKPQKNA